MDIIIPCAGLSTRFPNMRPKYLLMGYQGKRMLQLAADQYIGKHTVHVAILKQHEDSYEVSKLIKDVFGDAVNLIILPEPTSGPAETIYQTLMASGMDDSAPFMVHDCDSMFNHAELEPGNSVFVDSLASNQDIRNPGNKSYAEVNDQGIVISVIEKRIISDRFCVGGYQFSSVGLYRRSYLDIKRSRLGEIYMSSIIDHLISQGTVFTAKPVTGYVDMGTKDDWERYNDKPTIFCDIDGTLVHNQGTYGRNAYGTPAKPLEGNVNAIRRALSHGCQVIFTTSRPSRFMPETRKLLDDLGFAGCQLIMDLHHSRRIVINDHAATNPYPSASAINIKRDDDVLEQLLRY